MGLTKQIITKDNQQHGESLVEHFFKNKYGKIVSVISKYVGIETAEDVAQETFLTAVEHWKYNGIPPNPNAWLYTTAKNKALNLIRNQKTKQAFQNQSESADLVTIEFTDEIIADDQLRVMAECCQHSLSEETQITLILKILCGFSIAEIAAAFCTKSETINKRLVRGRSKLRKEGLNHEKSININLNLAVLLKTIYLLFNEGYFPSRRHQVIREDFCFEAIRLTQIIVNNKIIVNKESAHAMLALMCLNASRFKARIGAENEMIEMEHQDRTLWNQELLNKGLFHLKEAQRKESVSKYLVLASISANHCIAATYEKTNWGEILSLYDVLLKMENSALVKLNRLVALSNVKGSRNAITELLQLEGLQSNHLYYATLGALSNDNEEYTQAIDYYKKALSMASNPRDKTFLVKKINSVVPISTAQV